jgi:LPXTG-site transpeptidase (sortase) family protein
VVYTPVAGYVGTDAFDYTVSDGNGGIGSATVFVTVENVNDAPDTTPDTATVSEDASVVVDVLGNDTDPEGDPLTVTAVSQPASGTVTLVGGVVTYIPDPDFYGTDSFTYTVSDGNGGSSTETVTVTVLPVNDAPVAVDDAVNASEDTTESIALADLFSNDTDVDGDSLTLDSFTQPGHGTLTLVGSNLEYVPEPGYSGVDSFYYTVTDGNGTKSTATVDINVASVNDIPVANDDTVDATEDMTATIAIADLLGNDTDADGDLPTLDSFTSPAHGTLTLVGSDLVYVPDADYHGVDTFTYTISDGNGGYSTATVTLNVASMGEPDSVTVSKSLAPNQDAFVQVGQHVTFAIRVENAGDTTVTAGTVTDTYDPTYLSFVDASAPAVESAGTLAFGVPTLAPGTSTTITVEFHVEAQPGGGMISNLAAIDDLTDAEGTVFHPSGDNATVAVTRPSVTVTKLLAPWQSSWVTIDEPVAFRMVFVNDGDTTMTTLPALDTYDATELTFVSASTAPSSATRGLLRWANLGSLAPGASITLDTTFTASGVPADFTASNTLSVTGATDANDDESPHRESVAIVNFAQPRVEIAKHLSAGQRASVYIGETVNYDITVTNSGNTTITAAPLADEYTGPLAFKSSNTPDANATTTASGGTITWADITAHLGDIVPGETATVTVQFVSTSAGTVSNGAVMAGAVDASGHEVPTYGDADNTLEITGQPLAELRKTAAPEPGTVLMPGDIIRFTLSFENTTTVPMPDVVIGDVMPDAVEYVVGTMRADLGTGELPLTDDPDADAGAYDSPAEKISVAAGTLRPGERGTVTFDARVLDARISRPGVFNQFTLTSGQYAEQLSNRTVHPVDPWDITKSVKDVNGGALKAGDKLLWTITVTNTGLIPTMEVVVTDRVPSQTTYVTDSITGRGADDTSPTDLRWNLGVIPVGGVETLTFESTVNSGLKRGTVIRNQAYVDSAETERKGSDDPGTRSVGDATLAQTGYNDWILVGLVIGLLAAGLALIVWGARSRIAAFARRMRHRFGDRGIAVVAGVALLAAAVFVTMAANSDEIAYRLGLMDSGVTLAQPSGEDADRPGGSATLVRDSLGDWAAQGSGRRVIIPRIGVSVPIGDEEGLALRRGAWHQPGSARPGESGNVVLAGHRNRRVFTLLNKLEPGDVIIVRWGGKDREYRVASSRVVKPTSTAAIARAGKDRLTLYTCIPRYLGNKRTVVVAYPVGSATAQTNPGVSLAETTR